MRQEPKLFSPGGKAVEEEAKDGFRVEPRRPARQRTDDDHDGGEGRGFPWRIVVGGVLLAVVGVAAWQGAGLLTGGTEDSGEVPVFVAEVEPFKHRPDDPGGLEIQGTDSALYDGVLLGEDGEAMEQLLPDPEEPMEIATGEGGTGDGVIDVVAAPVADPELPTVETDPLFSSEQVGELLDQVMTDDGAIPIPAEKPAAPAAPEVTIAEVEVGGAPAETAESTSSGLSFDDVAASLGGEEGSSGNDGGTASAAAEETVTASAAPETGGGDGVSRVQIAAYLTPEAANDAWQRLARENNDLLATVDARVVSTEIAGTTYHRLQVGAYGDPAQARSLCDALKRRQIDCMVVGP